MCCTSPLGRTLDQRIQPLVYRTYSANAAIRIFGN